MVALYFAGVMALVIVYFAFRIILGWILPAHVVAGFDQFVDRSMKLLLKLIVVAVGCMIVFVVYWAATHS